jgi:release factor glutamine methyltransferase
MKPTVWRRLMKVREALGEAAARLAAISETPRLDAELLMAFVLGLDREDMLLRSGDTQTPPGFGDLVERRLAYEPIAYIVGRRAFWTIELEVGPGVLVPRPDSETLIEAALGHFGASGPRSILDLGTGPGTLLLAALDQWPQAEGLGIDRSDVALTYARRNAERLGLAERARFRLGDWTSGLDGRFDLILCNPPYIATTESLPPDVQTWEPSAALLAGPDGLDDYRRLAPQLNRSLATGGLACIEIGAGQLDRVSALFAAEGFTISSRSDLSNVVRCLLLRP